MTGRERFLAAMNRQQADRLPCQVHGWMWYWLQTYLQGKDQYQAYEHFDMDPAIYVEHSIMAAIDNPPWMHHVLDSMLAKKLRVIETTGRFQADLTETGGGSNTVISPAMHEEFCLPYDRKQHEAMRASGARIVYHLCGGLMKMLDLVVRNGADGLETMTPASMGGDCDLAEAHRQAGDKLFFIGGFDQNAGFAQGAPEKARKQVRALDAACPCGRCICCPSDHFFFGSPDNVKAFADEAKACKY